MRVSLGPTQSLLLGMRSAHFTGDPNKTSTTNVRPFDSEEWEVRYDEGWLRCTNLQQEDSTGVRKG